MKRKSSASLDASLSGGNTCDDRQCFGWDCLRPSRRARAAGFDCALARTPVEKAICADAKLGTLDEDVNAAYLAGRARLSSRSAAELQSDRTAWLAWLPKVCPTTLFKTMPDLAGYLNRPYADQLAMLSNGFVEGRFSLPEIDRPTPNYTAWKQAVVAEVVLYSTGVPRREQKGSTSKMNL